MSDPEEAKRLEAEWMQRRREWQEIHDLYISTGSSVPIERSARMVTPGALEEMAAAKQAEDAAYRRYLEALRQA